MYPAGMPGPPLVSVIIPTRDRRRLVTRAVASVRSQTYPHMEIIVVDDGSSDGTAEVMAEHGDVTLIRLEPAIGGAAARNRGIRASQGELVAFLDSDDEWLPRKIERQVALLTASERLGAVYCRHLHHDDATDRRGLARSELYRGDITHHLLTGRCPRTVSLFLVRRAALDSVEGFDEDLRGFQDTDLWIRMSSQWDFDAVDEPLVVVHNHDGARITTDIGARHAALDSFLGKWGDAMEAQIGRRGVDRYRRRALAVAQGATVVSAVNGGRRLAAVRALGTYLRMARLSNPRQLAGLVAACVGGTGFQSRLKRATHRNS